MPEVYALRAPENFDYDDDHQPSPASVKDYRNDHSQKSEMYYLKPNNDKQSPSSPVYKNSSLSRMQPELYHLKIEKNDTRTSDLRSSPVLVGTKRKSPIPYQPTYGQTPEMYHLNAGDQKLSKYDREPPYTSNVRRQSKSNTIMTHLDSPYQSKATMYMITAPDGAAFSPYISRTPSPPIRPMTKKQLVTFATVNGNDQQRHFSTTHRDVPINTRYELSIRSKASESIQRSMNKYRFNGS